MDKISKKILELHKAKKKPQKIQEEIKKKFNTFVTVYHIKKIILTNSEEESGEVIHYKMLVKEHNTKKRNKALQKESEALKKKLSFEDELKLLIESSPKFKPSKMPKKPIKSGVGVIEIVLSDIHIGLETKSFNFDSVIHGLEKIAKRINKKSPKKVIIACLGDVIHSSFMHQRQWESCSMTDAEQVYKAIEAFNYFLSLITCRNIEFIGIAGNHDRVHRDKTSHTIGKAYFTYTIYKTLELINQDIKFTIPDDAYVIHEINGKNFLYEHGDYATKFHMTDIGNHIRKREKLLGESVYGFRMGHYHSARTLLDGRYLCNGSFVTNDQYADTHGFGDGEAPVQIIIEHSQEEFCIYFFDVS